MQSNERATAKQLKVQAKEKIVEEEKKIEQVCVRLQLYSCLEFVAKFKRLFKLKKEDPKELNITRKANNINWPHAFDLTLITSQHH